MFVNDNKNADIFKIFKYIKRKTVCNVKHFQRDSWRPPAVIWCPRCLLAYGRAAHPADEMSKKTRSLRSLRQLHQFTTFTNY